MHVQRLTIENIRLIRRLDINACGTELFGEGITRSEQSKEKLENRAHLSRKRQEVSSGVAQEL